MSTYAKILERRTDQTEYLIHWTTSENFVGILKSGFLRATFAVRGWHPDARGNTIKGHVPAVCFSEMPVGNYLQSAVANPSRYPRHAIAIPKKVLYAYGARPVLYSDDRFDACLKQLGRSVADQYRFLYMKLDLSVIPSEVTDWTHEREWRVRPNTKVNEAIGLPEGIQLDPVPPDKWKIKSEWVVPLHLPESYTCDSLPSGLPDDPQFVLLVETEGRKKVTERVIRNYLGAGTYTQIQKYQSKYLEVVKKAHVISFEQIRDERDRNGLWRLEDVLNPSTRPQSEVAAWWDRAKTETRRQVLKQICTKGKDYEYQQWQNLPGARGTAFFSPSVQDRIQGNERAREMLKADVMGWVQETLGIAISY